VDLRQLHPVFQASGYHIVTQSQQVLVARKRIAGRSVTVGTAIPLDIVTTMDTGATVEFIIGIDHHQINAVRLERTVGFHGDSTDLEVLAREITDWESAVWAEVKDAGRR
jgi:hypothetical protein